MTEFLSHLDSAIISLWQFVIGQYPKLGSQLQPMNLKQPLVFHHIASNHRSKLWTIHSRDEHVSCWPNLRGTFLKLIIYGTLEKTLCWRDKPRPIPKAQKLIKHLLYEKRSDVLGAFLTVLNKDTTCTVADASPWWAKTCAFSRWALSNLNRKLQIAEGTAGRSGARGWGRGRSCQTECQNKYCTF